MKIKSVLFFPNGVAMIFDENGEQIPKYQKNGWFEMYIRYLKDQGADLEDCKFTLPDGKQARLLEREGSMFNWEIIQNEPTA